MESSRSHARSQRLQSPVRVWELTVLAICAVLIAGFSMQRAPISSAETRFVERSESGMQIVPASCPSDPHYDGECSDGSGYSQGSYYSQSSYYSQAAYCSATYFCSGTNLYYRSAACADTFVQACAWGCGGGSCLPPPPPEFVPWNYTWDGQSVASDGTLTAQPRLVRMGETSTLYWNTKNVTECTVTEDNPDIGDSWTGASSGVNGKLTSGITQKTVYTLTCTGVDGSTLTDSETINIIPVWQEQ